MTWLIIIIIIGVIVIGYAIWFIRHQRRLGMRAHLIQEAIHNRDFTFRLPTDGLLSETLNSLGETIHQQVNQNEVESWERLTRVLTHEIMNATAPITSISQSLLSRPDVRDSQLEEGIRAIHETSSHLSEFVSNYRKMSELEKPKIEDVGMLKMIDDIRKAYPLLAWEVSVSSDLTVRADVGMLRQVLMNLVKNAIEAQAQKIVVEESRKSASPTLCIGNDGLPILAENRQSLFVPFFTTKRSGNGIGLSISRRIMTEQGGWLELEERNLPGCHVTFKLTFQ